MEEIDVLILGAGLAGLSSSYHVGHDRCALLEAKSHPFGHIASQCIDGFTWDEGPHVSFTKHAYVQQLFEESVGGEFLEFPVKTTNFYKGQKVDHPAQVNLYQLEEPLRKKCLADFLKSRESGDTTSKPKHYGEWLYRAFGKTFADTFPRSYTRKYWTTDPENLSVDWVGSRVFYPQVEDVVNGSKGALPEQAHYIKQIRYPKSGGYQSYGELFAQRADIRCNQKVVSIDLEQQVVETAEGATYHYSKLINTLPLPVFVELAIQSSEAAKQAAKDLCCSELLLVNVSVGHATMHPEHWFYVYDEEMLSTRIYCTEQLSPNNAPNGSTGIQVEVYASKYRPFELSHEAIGAQVVAELETLGFVKSELSTAPVQWHVQHVPYANIVFDHKRERALEVIYSELEAYRLVRESDALDPMIEWGHEKEVEPSESGAVYLAGRFGQWKYLWSDDCVLRGKQISEEISARK
jgi:protoporphyrinogen oxidase